MNMPAGLLPSSRFAVLILTTSLLAACVSSPPPVQRRHCPPPNVCPACPVCPAPQLPQTPIPPAQTPVPSPTSSVPPAPTPPVVAPTPAPSAGKALQRAQWSDLLGWAADQHEQAWPALLKSCSTIAQQPTWQSVCATAQGMGTQVSRQAARQFFEQHFQPWRAVNPDGSTNGLITGYYEPLIKGSRQPSTRYAWPIHARPRDMLSVELNDLFPELKNKRVRGRQVGERVVPYWTRGEINKMGSRLPADILAWAEDPIELFFLQVQGSGQLQLPNGERMRIGYADQNGHPYQSIGRWLVAQGELTLDKASMEGIKTWVRNNPHRLQELLAVNPSYIFFRALPPSQDGPIGALNVPLTAERSLAIDRRYIPLGAPVFLSTTYPNRSEPLRRLMVAQDTGSAITGVVRGDFFWGFGAEAGAEAGRMRQQGQMWVLLPRHYTPE